MRRNLNRLANRYIDKVIQDQRKLGYSKTVPAKIRKAAVADAELVLRELAQSSRPAKTVTA
jgi:hypothetical protein